MAKAKENLVGSDPLRRVIENPRRLEWTDAQGDRFQIQAEATVADHNAIACILVGDHADGEEAAVWITEKDAQRLIAWLTERLQ